jgi:hypothetical protein
MRFHKGQSGNPAGRPPGSRNRATIFAEALLEGEAEFIFHNVIRKAIDGEHVFCVQQKQAADVEHRHKSRNALIEQSISAQLPKPDIWTVISTPSEAKKPNDLYFCA